MDEVSSLRIRVPNGRSQAGRTAAFWILTAVGALALGQAANAETVLEARLRNRIESGLTSDGLEVMGERIHARETMRRLYPERGYEPFWVTEDGITERGATLERWLAVVPEQHGLRARDYHLRVIGELDGEDRLSAIVDLELALTDSFLIVGSHLLAGRLNPETLDAEWFANRRHRDLGPVLEKAGASDNPGTVLEALLPNDEAYDGLVAALAALRRERDAGGWRPVSAGPTLRAGDSGERVEELVSRLASSGDLRAGHGTRFDADVTDAVRRFQTRHGLVADGIVGGATLRAMNVPIQSRIDQIVVNLERWRWLPEDLGDYYVIVNIAGFRLDVVRDDQSVLDMRVVVGAPYRRTPVFSGSISYLVINPYWEVPTRIAVEDKLPQIKADAGYLARQGFTLLQGWGESERVIDPATVDWTQVSARNFPYRLRQSPGPFNALGRVKFMFPNKFSVYLHDTPARELFGQTTRAFSSGCIRLEHPLDLAGLLLENNSAWTPAAIEAAVQSGNEQTVRLASRVPVHLLYWTAWISSADGQLQFREDIYGRDPPVLRELRESPPS